jgi:sugar (glycoside-pentoside-hexuronide) transporter
MATIQKFDKKSKYVYSTAAIGRDMMYALYSTYLLVFLTNAVGLPDWELVAVGVIIAIARVWDAINDTFMGIIIDNTRSRFGKFKPWLLLGAITSAVVFFALFQDFGLLGWPFVIVFSILYVLSGMTFTMNDISYWSMYPTFTTEPKERESIGSLARIFASLGMFIVIAFVPIFYQNYAGGPRQAFMILAIVIGLIFIGSQLAIFLFVKEPKNAITHVKQEKTQFKNLLKIIFKNDQLVVIIVAILLFNTGYFITTALGIYFFDFDFNRYGGTEFMIFSGILAVSQLTAISLFPLLSRKIGRKNVFTLGVVLVIIGYVLFMSVKYILPMNMLIIGIAGLVLFSGQGFIQVLVLVMLADTIEYGQWKLGTRNDSVVFSINPFVTKLATAFQNIVVTMTLAFSGLNKNVIKPVADAVNANPDMETAEIRTLISTLVDDSMLLWLRVSMIVLPLILIIASYIIYRWKYKLDEKMYSEITADLLKRVTAEEKFI